MKKAIIGGTGIYEIPDLTSTLKLIDTRYGQAHVYLGEGEAMDLVFLPRHGPDHQVPPHRINYQANIMALKQLGVQRVLATFTVGSLHEDYPPRSITALDQFIDFSFRRESTFFNGGETGVIHTEVTDPFCPALRGRLLGLAGEHGVKILPTGTYVCVNGPRFETAAEVRMFAQWGGHVVGMTAVPEVSLSRELGIHYAAVAISVNWGAGFKGDLEVDTESPRTLRPSLLSLFIDVLRTIRLEPCHCESSALIIHPPSKEA